jgi:hypothetical protein
MMDSDENLLQKSSRSIRTQRIIRGYFVSGPIISSFGLDSWSEKNDGLRAIFSLWILRFEIREISSHERRIWNNSIKYTGRHSNISKR